MTISLNLVLYIKINAKVVSLPWDSCN